MLRNVYLWHLILLIIVCQYIDASSARSNRDNVHSADNVKTRVCGTRLMNTLKKLCNHCYAFPSYNHRRSRRENRQEFEKKLKDELFENLRLLRTKRSARRDETAETFDRYFAQHYESTDYLMNGSIDQSRGIATRCCLNQCGWNELKNFCCK
uniref:Insulin-like domain-containing protein n=1 Tax=Romanomermis culicivorax TaxID=13658 RepID=A0A915J3D4_ROMCU